MTDGGRKAAEGAADGEGGSRRWAWRYLPLAALAIAIVSAFALDLPELVSFETLHEHDRMLRQIVDRRPALAALTYFSAYILVVLTALPAVVLMTVVGGYLFGIWVGGGLAVAGATTGAVCIFLVARTSFGRRLGVGSGALAGRLRAGFQENAWSYLFVLRLLPVLPFMVVNVVPALLGVPLRTYTLATFLGMLPGSFVYASAGNGLGTIMAMGEQPGLDVMLEPTVLGPLIALAVLALLPVVYKRLKRRTVAR